ncbi:MAG: Eco57I restriction-modification methylase domain-containing protein [Prevotellaceae bacterium]|nr:Eco57I restriction-modification methylase domain-containing protein [Prevotellaceae bacterium]
MYKILKPSQSIAKAYLRERPEANEVKAFRDAMKELLEHINPSEHEEFNKNLVAEFLNKSLYSDKNYMVNTYQRTDLAIYTEMGTHNEHPVVLFEFKGPSRPDMVSKDNLKKKALFELILYYIREEVKNRNTDIKHLVITNCWEYFIFEKKLFYQLFARNKRFVQMVLDADTGDNNTDYIYNTIIKPEVERLEHLLQFVYIDLRAFERDIKKEDVVTRKPFVAVYKMFSPTHLLKLPFTSDHNTLNKHFYSELLYIMGVEEDIDKGVHKIKRLKKGKQSFSLAEQAYENLEGYSSITNEEEQFEAALGLVLTWINRVLFLKLLESQLVSFNKGRDVKFLDTAHIQDYDVLHALFMQVMAKPVDERTDDMKRQFPDVPYLNSSLFELAKIEETFFPISGIRMGEMDVYTKTVLKDGKGKKVTGKKSTLDYLFSFLDAYDFGTEQSQAQETVRTDSDKLINASVLGLIFEKINGYKDGSFFTPGYITEYICNKTLRRAIIDKFNNVKGWKCEDFEDLKEAIEYGKREVRTEANEIINSLRICDPAVGSGHFLVSALNEMIAIKRELGVLQDHQALPKRINEYDIKVEYDELVISDEDDEIFRYDPSNPSSQRIQETLFEEKRTIIENCLFGVDLNPKSVDVCRLRLWIELLKNAYYYKNDKGERLLQTLPNIDINIKCGNSLASTHPVSIGHRINKNAGNQDGIQELVREYKQNVREYKNCLSKATRNRLFQDITDIKQKLSPPIMKDLFGDNTKETNTQKVLPHSLEWMIEFPEVLNEDGTFGGFDVIIGNPPYISLEKLKTEVSVYGKMHRIEKEGQGVHKTYKTLEPRGDIYALFVERGLHLLRQGGYLSYIIPNKWEKVMYGRPLRELFLQQNLTHLVDFGDNQIFEDATTYTCIIRMKKEKQDGRLFISTLEKVNPEMLSENVEEEKEEFDTTKMSDEIWVISSLHNFNAVKRYKTQMITLGEYVGGESYRGILTGLSKAFNIDIDKAKELITQDIHSKDLLRPFLQGRGLVAYGKAVPCSYLVFIPKGFTIQHMGVDTTKYAVPTEDEAWIWFNDKYPAIAAWLEQFREEAKTRTDKGDYWWELRACAYYDKFAEHKLFYQVFQTKSCFVYDDSSTFCNNSMYFISVPDKALLALLCSRIGWWLITEFCPRIQHGAQLIWDNFRQIPVPKELPPVLNEYADKMMAVRDDEEQFQNLSKEIDKIIASLYGFSDD